MLRKLLIALEVVAVMGVILLSFAMIGTVIQAFQGLLVIGVVGLIVIAIVKLRHSEPQQVTARKTSERKVRKAVDRLSEGIAKASGSKK